MGQHRRVIQRKYQPPVKNSQSAFRQNPHEALQTRGSGLVMSSLWDGSDSKLHRHADLIASYLKSYNFKRTTEKKPSNGNPSNKSVRKNGASYQDDHLLRLDFGGLFANLEDREWRIIPKRIEDGPQHLKFKSGDLAMVVFPDHQTLSLAMQCDAIMKRIILPGRPSVCMVSREVIQSV